ncbi:MAG: inosine/xanthosine triphosphatase [Candidatus Bathyarchaeota archaeon]
MIVAVGSTSPVKINAVKQAFSEYYSGFQIEAVSIPSGVNPYPWSDEEMLRGALNRARGAQGMVSGADFAVGIEGGLQQLEAWMIVKQLSVVIKGDEIGVGLSSGYDCPKGIIDQIKPQKESNRQNIDSFFGENEILSKEGPIGVLTKSKMTRTDSSRDAVLCALTRFVSQEYYLKGI